MDRVSVPVTPSPLGNPRCDNGGGYGRVGGWTNKASTVGKSGDRDEEDVEEAEKCNKTKRKKKKRKKGEKDVEGGGKWTFGGLFRRKKKKEEEQECAKESTEEEYGAPSVVKDRNLIVPQSISNKRTNEGEYSERLVGGGSHPCSLHNGCSGCVVTSNSGRSRQRPTFGSSSDCGRDGYLGTGLVRRDSSTSSHKERKEMIKARVEAMRERLPRDSSSEDELLPGGGSEGSWEYRVRRAPLPPGPGGHPPHPAGSVGSAGSSPYLGRRSRFTGRTERFHQRRMSREYRDDAEEEELWRKRANKLPPQCIPWRASQSDAEAPYIGCRTATVTSGSTIERAGLGSGSALSHSPAPSPMNSPMLGGRRSVNSATSPSYGMDSVGLPIYGSNRCIPRRYPSSPISPQTHTEGQSESRAYGPSQQSLPFPARSRSTDLLFCWRPEEGRHHQSNEPNPFHFPSPPPKQPIVQRNSHELNNQFHHHTRWPSAPSRSPPPPPPPRDPQRRVATPQSFSHFVMRECAPPPPAHHDVGGFVTRRNYHQQQNQPHTQQRQENPYMNVEVKHVHVPLPGSNQGVQTCYADSQPRSRRPLRVTQGGSYYGARPPGDVSYMSDSQVGSVGRRQVHPILMQHPPLESHYAVPFLAEPPPPRCAVNRVSKDPQVAEGVIHSSRPLMRQQRLPVFNRSRSSSPAPAGVSNRPPHLQIRPFDGSNENHPITQRGHSSAPQTPIDGPINRPLSIVSEEKGDLSPRVPPVPPARSSSRRSSISSVEAMDYGVWAMDRPSKAVNRGPSGLEDAITELENIYKSLKFEDDVDGETDSNAMGSSELGLPFDDQERPLTDDMAYRRLHSKEKTSPTAQHGVGGIVAQAGSYLLVSPTLGPADPWTEPPPNSVNPGEPDITLDDVVFRSVRQANAHIPVEPQPPFGIPLGPVTRAPESDYLHVKPPSPSPTRPVSISSKKTPDVVKDDLAFRSLRKDRLPSGSPVPMRGISSPPPRPSSSFSGVSSPPPLPTPGVDFQAIRKKRAVRSLSANLLGILQNASITARSSSPPLYCPSAISLKSPPSPRKEVHELPSSPTSRSSASHSQILPSGNVSMYPLAPSEDSEPYHAENRAQVNDATSSDTLTEGHADEPKKKPDITEHVSVEQVTSPVKSPENSPGEVYEALGRVLSRVAKESEEANKGTNDKSEDDGDLQSLLAALAKEARTTSENLGRELDQLKTSNVKISDETGFTGKRNQVVTSKVLSSSPNGQVSEESMAKAEAVAEKLRREKSYCGDRSSSPHRIGAIASLALRGLEKSRALSSSSSPDSSKMDDLSVVVGKCTVETDAKHPGSIVSFTSSVSPIKSSAKHSSGRLNESVKESLVSTASVDIPMALMEDKPNGKEESTNMPIEVSTASAGIPIKSGRLGYEVDQKSDPMQRGSFEMPKQQIVSPDTSIASRDPGTITQPSDSLNNDQQSMADRLNTVKMLPDSPNVRKEVSKIEENIRVKSIKENPREPVEERGIQKLSLSSSVSRDSKRLNESDSCNIESAPITGSMRLVVSRDLENPSNPASPKSAFQCNWLVRTESEPAQLPPKSAPEDTLRKTDLSVPTSDQSVPITPTESDTKSNDGVNFVFHGSDRSSLPTRKFPSEQNTPPSAVVEEIQKEFDQLLCTIPAKKPRTSKESESLVELSSPIRMRVTESKSLEHPRRAPREVRLGQEGLRKTFPKYLDSSLAKTSITVRSSDSVAAPKESRTSDEVTFAFEREFEALWKASNKNDGNEPNRMNVTTVGLDGALERQLDQLHAEVKKDSSQDVIKKESSPKEASTPGERDAEGEACPTVLLSSGKPKDEPSQASSAAAACALKPAVAASAPACLTLKAICYPCKTASNVQPLDQTNSSFCSSMVAGFLPEPGDPMFTAMAAFLALVTLIAALLVRPY